MNETRRLQDFEYEDKKTLENLLFTMSDKVLYSQIVTYSFDSLFHIDDLKQEIIRRRKQKINNIINDIK